MTGCPAAHTDPHPHNDRLPRKRELPWPFSKDGARYDLSGVVHPSVSVYPSLEENPPIPALTPARPAKSFGHGLQGPIFPILRFPVVGTPPDDMEK
jgi:hypothetical protein